MSTTYRITIPEGDELLGVTSDDYGTRLLEGPCEIFVTKIENEDPLFCTWWELVDGDGMVIDPSDVLEQWIEPVG